MPDKEQEKIEERMKQKNVEDKAAMKIKLRQNRLNREKQKLLERQKFNRIVEGKKQLPSNLVEEIVGRKKIELDFYRVENDKKDDEYFNERYFDLKGQLYDVARNFPKEKGI